MRALRITRSHRLHPVASRYAQDMKYLKLFIYHIVTPAIGLALWCCLGMLALLFVLWVMAHLGSTA
jgi:hypothetical protein